MRASNPSPVFVKPLDCHRLFLRFSNQEERIFDVSPYLEHKYFAALNNPVIFRTAKTNGLTVEWMGDIDICPDELYENSRPV
jgi:hypothetical protein